MARRVGPAGAAASLHAAVSLLTRLPVRPADGAGGGAAFALVGAGLGLLAALPVIVLHARSPLLGAMAALGTLAIASGGLHLDGLADTIDGLAAGAPEAAERARRDPAVGALGAAGLVIVLVAEGAAIASLPSPRLLPSLVLACASSRAVPVLGAHRSTLGVDGFGAWWGRSVGRLDACACSVVVVVLVMVAGPSHALAAAAAIGAGMGTLIWLDRRQGRVTGDAFGAAIELSFLASLIVQVVTP